MQFEVERHWATESAKKALKISSEQIIAAGWSPSGLYHTGSAKEAITCYGYYKTFELMGKKPKLIYIIDDNDPLDKIPRMLKKFSKQLIPYLGHRINEIPDPSNKYESYAELFLSGLKKFNQQFEFPFEYQLSSSLYKNNAYQKYLLKYLKAENEVQEIMKETTGSKMDNLFTVVCASCSNLKSTVIQNFDQVSVNYLCSGARQYKGCGYEGETKLNEGGWKLKWRLEFPARQDMLNVTIEPSGKDHAVAGGSIDTGKKIHKRIFKKEPPVMPRYGFITLGGKKISASKGKTIPATQVIDYIEPAAFKFLIYSNYIQTDIDFNPETEQYGKLIDKFVQSRRALNNKFQLDSKNEAKLKTAAKLALNKADLDLIPAMIKSSELLLLYQTNFRNPDRTIEKLQKMDKIENDDSIIELKQRIRRTEYWLDNLAPSQLKFQILEHPKEGVKKYWNPEIVEVWTKTALYLQNETDKTKIMDYLRKQIKENGIDVKNAFQAFYQLLFEENTGPNAIDLCISLGKDSILKKIDSLKKFL